MKPYSKLNNRGFTLVELMLVVMIIGVLAALAVYGAGRYLAGAKISEAKSAVGAISRGATSAFERESAASEAAAEGNESKSASHSLCQSAAPVPGSVPAGTKYQPNTAEGNDYETGTSLQGWKCLMFSISQPQYYQYQYNVNTMVVAGNPAACTADCYEAAARSDLHNDGVVAGISRTGQINTATGKLKASTQLFLSSANVGCAIAEGPNDSKNINWPFAIGLLGLGALGARRRKR